MESSYGHQNIAPEAYFSGKNVVETNDSTLPFELNRFVANNYEYRQQTTVIPAADNPVYISGNQTAIRFCIATPQNMVISPSESYFTYNIAIGPKGSTTYFTKTDAAAGTYCSITGLTAGTFNSTTGAVSYASLGASTTLNMVYLKNSLTPFRDLKISDIGGTQVIDEIEYPGLLTQMCLTSQDQDFWDDTNLEADKYGAHVMKYRDPKFYIPKGATVYNQMCPTSLIPVLDNDSLPLGGYVAGTTTPTTSVLMPDVQRQQMELWPLSNSSSTSNYAMPLIVYPVSDFLRTSEKLYCFFNKILIQFFLNSYDDAITDCKSVYGATSGPNNVPSWTYSSNGGQFTITNIEWHLMTYTMMDDIKAKLMACASGPGIEIPYSQTIWTNGNPFQYSSNLMTITVDKRNINNLQKLLICFRRVPDSSNNSNADAYVLRSLDDTELANTTYPPAFSDFSTAMQGYNGLHKVQLYWQQRRLPQDDFIYIHPYGFQKVKDFCADAFGDSRKENIQSYLYDGIETKGTWKGVWMNCNSQFFLGFSFETVPRAEMSGLSLTKSNLDIQLETKGGTSPTRTNAANMSLFLIAGSKCVVSPTGISVVS
jgi:hypothetical protein